MRVFTQHLIWHLVRNPVHSWMQILEFVKATNLNRNVKQRKNKTKERKSKKIECKEKQKTIENFWSLQKMQKHKAHTIKTSSVCIESYGVYFSCMYLHMIWHQISELVAISIQGAKIEKTLRIFFKKVAFHSNENN